MDEEASRAAERAGVEVRELSGLGEVAEAASLFARVWREPGGCEPLPANVLSALVLSRNYVAGAFEPGGAMVGASAGWATPPPGAELHSHITGVEPARHGGGVGRALKLHQRAWARQHGLGAVAWTFDPLVRRNAAFNLRTLSARVERYLENLYGALPDELNAGGESDRLLVRLAVDPSPPAPAAPASREAPRLLTVPTPEDIEALRREDPAEAERWRRAVREALAPVLAAGGVVVGLSDDGAYLVAPAVATEAAAR